jgi:hypothetical protein
MLQQPERVVARAAANIQDMPRFRVRDGGGAGDEVHRQRRIDGG